MKDYPKIIHHHSKIIKSFLIFVALREKLVELLDELRLMQFLDFQSPRPIIIKP